MELKPGVAVVSDIAVHHAETLYGAGTPTLAALCDLAEICQAAVLNETLVVSPGAYAGSTLLRQLEFVPDLTPVVAPVGSGDEPAADDAGDAVLIDVEDGVPVSRQPFGQLILALVAGEVLQFSPIFGGLANPQRLTEDRGLYFLDRLPTFLFLLQARKGAAAFETEDVRRRLLEATEGDRVAYADYAGRLLALHECYGVQPTFSCLEEPLGDDVRVGRAIDGVQSPRLWDEFHGLLHAAVVRDRREFFERWVVPPLGLMVLGRAERLEDLPAEIGELRDAFLAVRRGLIDLEEARRAALTAGNGLDDRRYKEAVAIDQRIRLAFEAFDAALADHRRAPAIKRAELAFNLPKYLAWLTSIGVGSLAHLIELADLRRRHALTYVPGLHKALSFAKACGDSYIAEIAERLLGRPVTTYGLHAEMLRLAAGKAEAYGVFSDGAAPVDDDVMRLGFGEETLEIRHSELWSLLIRHEELRRLLLHPQG